MKPRPRAVYVMLKHTATHYTHEFFIGDRWWRIVCPCTYRKDQAERALNRHITSKRRQTPEGVTITCR